MLYGKEKMVLFTKARFFKKTQMKESAVLDRIPEHIVAIGTVCGMAHVYVVFDSDGILVPLNRVYVEEIGQ